MTVVPEREDVLAGSGDLLHLLNARLWIARLGEGDVLRWWRSDGVLGRDGAFVGPRVLPKTHPTARARIVFAVARHACEERYPDPEARHLFRLDPETEDRVDALLVDKLGDEEYWSNVMDQLHKIDNTAIPAQILEANGIVKKEDVAAALEPDLGPGGRSLPVSEGETAAVTVRRLAAGFVRSKAGELVVPYLHG